MTPLPATRWTLAAVDAVAAACYWLGFVTVLAAAASRRLVASIRQLLMRRPID